MESQENNRRDFLQAALAGGAALGVTSMAEAAQENNRGLPTRPLGRTMEVLKQDLAIARRFPSLNAEALKKLIARVRPVAGDGRHERFKSTQFFDGPYHREQHGLTQKQVDG